MLSSLGLIKPGGRYEFRRVTHFAGRVQNQSADDSDAAMRAETDSRYIRQVQWRESRCSFLAGLDLHCTEHGAADMGVQWAW